MNILSKIFSVSFLVLALSIGGVLLLSSCSSVMEIGNIESDSKTETTDTDTLRKRGFANNFDIRSSAPVNLKQKGKPGTPQEAMGSDLDPEMKLTAADATTKRVRRSALADPRIKITATDTTTIREPNFAYQYVTFDIHSDTPMSVKLVLKERGQPAPTHQEVLDGAGIYRKLYPTNKSMVLMYDINSRIKEYRKALQATDGRSMNIIHDDAATDMTINTNNLKGYDAQNIDVLLLKPGTTYTLYAIEIDVLDTTEVYTLIDMTTSSFNINDLPDGDPNADVFPNLGHAFQQNQLYNQVVLYDSRDDAAIFPTLGMNLDIILYYIRIMYSINSVDLINMAQGVKSIDMTIDRLNADVVPYNGASLIAPSFSSTGGTNTYATYNDINYRYQYAIIYNDRDLFSLYYSTHRTNYTYKNREFTLLRDK